MSFHKIAIALGLVGCLAIVGTSTADILFPQMTPDKGTFEKPHGKIGENPTTPWSQTTVAAGVFDVRYLAHALASGGDDQPAFGPHVV